MLARARRGGAGRDAYTYLHLPIDAGVIVTLAGPIVYLFRTLAFRARMIGRVGVKRPVAIALLLGLGIAAPLTSALALAIGAAAVLVCPVAWERDATGALSASQMRTGPG